MERDMSRISPPCIKAAIHSDLPCLSGLGRRVAICSERVIDSVSDFHG